MAWMAGTPAVNIRDSVIAALRAAADPAEGRPFNRGAPFDTARPARSIIAG